MVRDTIYVKSFPRESVYAKHIAEEFDLKTEFFKEGGCNFYCPRERVDDFTTWLDGHGFEWTLI